jgi:hypothetical protein
LQLGNRKTSNTVGAAKLRYPSSAAKSMMPNLLTAIYQGPAQPFTGRLNRIKRWQIAREADCQPKSLVTIVAEYEIYRICSHFIG